MYVISPPPFLCVLSVRKAVYPGMFGVLLVVLSFVSCMVAMSILSLFSSSVSLSIFELSPLMLICSMFRFFFGLCVVGVVVCLGSVDVVCVGQLLQVQWLS